MTQPILIAPEGGWPIPWPLLFDVAEATPAHSWVLVGGMMVQAHAMLANIAPPRTTTDVDLLLDILSNRTSAQTVVTALRQIGFTTQEPGWPESPFHRLRRDGDVVDVLVADHLPKHVMPRVIRRPVMAVDGGSQALNRTMPISIDTLHGAITVEIPDQLGALILKAAAARADNRDKDRHLHDAALLAGLIIDHAHQRTRIHGSDRQRLTALAHMLADPYHPAWIALPDNLRQAGQDTLRILTN